ncbi:hypothetical protein F4810DRAFT_337002 [Camillea tinctor]|nr:hypothetical protein F4810DRAFT_337002 [Camillea tinctor]
MTQDINFPETYWVVESIDSCSWDRVQSRPDELLYLISSLMKYSDKIRCLVSSDRSVHSKSMADTYGALHISIDSVIPSTKSSLDSYITYKVSNLGTEKGYNTALGDLAKSTIYSIAPKKYFWVDIVCQALRNEDNTDPEDLLLSLCHELPSESRLEALLNFMENRLLQRNNKYHCIGVLSIMSNAYQPLHIDELARLAPQVPKQGLATIVKKCSAFLSSDYEFITFHHPRVRSYVNLSLSRMGKRRKGKGAVSYISTESL